MHEAAITKAIMDSVLKIVDEQGITAPIQAVHVLAGVCQGLIPDSMQMFFNLTKSETPLADAELIVTLQKMVAHCPQCARDEDLEVPVLFCSHCGGPMELIKGKELLLTAIEVKE